MSTERDDATRAEVHELLTINHRTCWQNSPDEPFHHSDLCDRLHADRDTWRARAEKAEALLNTPEILDFAKAVQLEAAHQRSRWGSAHDEGKADADWFWLIGYLGGKALHNPDGDASKQLHRIITVAAAACNWHAAKLGQTNVRPGIATPAGEAP